MSPTPDDERLAKRREYERAYYQSHKAAYADRHRRWRTANPERTRELRNAQYARNRASGKAREWHLRSRYGITLADEATLWESQQGCCAICRTLLSGPGGKDTHLDHDHATNRVRGFLCVMCNQGLGRFRDQPDLLLAAVQYLRRQ